LSATELNRRDVLEDLKLRRLKCIHASRQLCRSELLRDDKEKYDKQFSQAINDLVYRNFDIAPTVTKLANLGAAMIDFPNLGAAIPDVNGVAHERGNNPLYLPVPKWKKLRTAVGRRRVLKAFQLLVSCSGEKSTYPYGNYYHWEDILGYAIDKEYNTVGYERYVFDENILWYALDSLSTGTLWTRDSDKKDIAELRFHLSILEVCVAASNRAFFDPYFKSYKLFFCMLINMTSCMFVSGAAKPEPNSEVRSIQRHAVRVILKADVNLIDWNDMRISSKYVARTLCYRRDLFFLQPKWVIKTIGRILSRVLPIDDFNFFFVSRQSRKLLKLLFDIPEFGDGMVTNHSRWFFDLVRKREPLALRAIIEAEEMAVKLASLRDGEGRSLVEVAALGRKPNLMRESIRILKHLPNIEM